MTRRWYSLWRFLIVAAAFGIWWLISAEHLFSVIALASPSAVAKQIWHWVSHGSVSPANGTIWTSIGNTFLVFAVGYVAGIVCGVALGVMMGTSRLMRAYFEPFVIFFNAVPRLVLIPFFIVWLGFGPLPRIIIVFIVIVIVIAVTVQQGLGEMQKEFTDNARMLGASRRNLIQDVYVPGIVVWILSSARLAVGIAFQAAVVSEFFGGTEGLGYLINQGQQFLNAPIIYSAIIITSVLAWIIDYLMMRVQRRVTNWLPTPVGS